MFLSRKEKEALGFYTLESLIAFIGILVSVFLFAKSEDLMFLVSVLGFASIIVINEVRSKF